jgi:hypothetical protein
MTRKTFFLLLPALLSATLALAQTQTSGWLAAFTTFRASKHLSIHFDAQLRSTDALSEVQTVLLRPGINYHIGSHWILTAGYAFIPNRRTAGGITGLLPEHRAWQQVIYNHKWQGIATIHRLRFEERFIPRTRVEGTRLRTNGSDEAYRLRYFIRNIIPLQGGGAFTQGWFVALQNEVFINTGDKSAVNGRVFDQNRLYPAIGYRLKSKLDLEAGYMYQYIQGRAANVHNHIAQLALYKRL